MTERTQAFRRARAYHRRRHGLTLLCCRNAVCQNRVQRLRSRLRPWTIAPFEREGLRP